MRLGMVGLGKMGLNMTLRLRRGAHGIVAYDRSASAVRKAARAGAVPARSLEELVAKLPAPRVVWLMLPAGAPTQKTLDELAELLAPGDLVVDGGNSRYTDDAPRARYLGAKGLRYMDAGVSGGVWGLADGYCLMVGGERRDFKRLEPVLKALAPKDGYLHAGPIGAGHYTKMVHNGIEYGMMQAYAEGFALLKASGFDVDLAKTCALWNRGSVVRSWLLELAGSAFRKDPQLKGLRGWVQDSGEGRWTVLDAVERGVPVPVSALSLFARFSSREPDAFANKVLAALRNEFGGHAVVAPAGLRSRRPGRSRASGRGLRSHRPAGAKARLRDGGHAVKKK
ncbi:MAG: decarboxylating 6-phosphogluconate dehydrogenase [Elusimicrobiota bacterium]|jgi:6-phosphogluconate dehydrogenase